jgi:hypothetical protein
MVIKLKEEWFGNTVGTIIKVNDDRANSLFRRDIAEKMEPESSMAIKKKLQCMLANKIKKRVRKPHRRFDSMCTIYPPSV